MNKIFEPEHFIKSLKEGNLSLPLWLTGIVQPGSSDDELSFSFSSKSGNWVNLPVSLMDKVEFIKELSLESKKYPYVSILLRDPDKGNSELVALFQLLRSKMDGQAPGGCGCADHPTPIYLNQKTASPNQPETTRKCVTVYIPICWQPEKPRMGEQGGYEPDGPPICVHIPIVYCF